MRAPRTAHSRALATALALALAAVPGLSQAQPQPDPASAPPDADAANADAAAAADAAPPPVTSRRTVAWLAIGATLAFATSGAILAQSADAREDDLDYLLTFRDPVTGRPSRYTGETETRYLELRREGEELRFYSLVSFGLAGLTALSAAGILLFGTPPASRDAALSEQRSSKVPTLTPSASRDSVRVNLGWEF